jgi:Outer membrane protein beta-barrel domain
MTRLSAALFLVVAATPALADDPPAVPPTDPDQKIPDPFTPEAEAPSDEPTFELRSHTYDTVTTETRQPLWGGIAVSAGGGVSGFTSASARDATNDGGNWDVRATIGTHSPIAAEVSYLGSAQSIDALGLDDSAVLLGSGVQANVRINLTTTSAVQPFLFAGAAWRHYSLENVDTNTSDVSSSDDVLELPVGAGLAYRYRGFILDARGEFRATTNNDLLPSLVQEPLSTDNQAELHRWGVNANIGYEF